MESVDISKGTIWEDGHVTEMARFLVDGVEGVKADVASLTRKIYNKSNDNELIASDILIVDDTIFDDLQTDARWSEDTDGYNFKDTVAGSNFATGGATYRIEYHFVGPSEEKFFIVYEHFAQEIIGS